jgi:hypothetical protein
VNKIKGEYIMTKKNVYNWAVVGSNGQLRRERSGRRAIYRTREQARQARWQFADGRVVRRDMVGSSST